MITNSVSSINNQNQIKFGARPKWHKVFSYCAGTVEDMGLMSKNAAKEIGTRLRRFAKEDGRQMPSHVVLGPDATVEDARKIFEALA